MSTDIQFVDHAPAVFVIGVSTPVANGFRDYLAYRGETWNGQGFAEHQFEALIESAGRVCYQSWSNPANRFRDDYIQEQIVGHGHGSVCEHPVINFLVADLPRSSQLELVRHGEGTAFSFESTRFTDKHLRFIVPPRLRDTTGPDSMGRELWEENIIETVEIYKSLVRGLKRDSDEGTLRTKRAKEAARSILPNSQGSDGQVSINLRALRHIIHMRTDPHADQSIREFLYNIYLAAKPYYPSLFADAEVIPQEEGVPQIKFKYEKV